MRFSHLVVCAIMYARSANSEGHMHVAEPEDPPMAEPEPDDFACCTKDGCVDVESATCTERGGFFYGDNESCSQKEGTIEECRKGACCLPDGGCDTFVGPGTYIRQFKLFALRCVKMNGIVFPESGCEDVEFSCPKTACCLPDGGCETLFGSNTPKRCDDLNGTLILDTTCKGEGTNVCSDSGATTPDATTPDATTPDATTPAATMPETTAMTTTPAPLKGACCTSHECVDTTYEYCEQYYYGTFLGPGTSCYDDGANVCSEPCGSTCFGNNQCESGCCLEPDDLKPGGGAQTASGRAKCTESKWCECRYPEGKEDSGPFNFREFVKCVSSCPEPAKSKKS